MGKVVIWDLDGTLIDSYELIVVAISEVLSRYNTKYSKEDIYKYVKKFSVEDFFKTISKELGVEYQIIRDLYTECSKNNIDKYIPILHALDILEILKQKGVENFIFTHKGKSTYDVLKNLNMLDYFKEIVTRENGFARKPEPDAINYLIEKYLLERKETYYVGDREIDVECAKNAGVKSILLDEEGSLNDIIANYKVKDLLEIKDII